jgi:uroporphyrinogen decarboxylase
MSEFLRACRREPTAYTPIWLMRQAGRYQPEYRALRERYSFVELCKNSELAAEVTLLPVQQLGVDAAIIFADILLILEPLGIGFHFAKDDGPRIDKPVRNAADVNLVHSSIDADDSLGYVMQSIRNTRSGLPANVPLIGFAGAPFTLASYVIEGGGSRDYMHTKALMYGDPGAWDALMEKLTAALVSYLNAQVRAGAQALQLFDSWVGCLSPTDYERYVAPHMRKLFAQLDKSVPVIHFGTGNPALYPLMKDAGGDVIGLDFRCELGATWDTLGSNVAVMGNIDPYSLLAPLPELRKRVKHVLDGACGRPGHIFNLGHGIFPQASVEKARALVDFVHELSAR